eukprot:CAMPEP_0179155118 /NCGR_PEP_ID=MMETSP0796-20121207/75541_1 /TAXON_ID=73915 /ORGANISM="Pyrodinium bahamense, Strain pbaha01" /LENGTH=82 /DNA_ID=CAMNT_0020856571 /DNA_START=70 /DNA_END=314 /DNA_ORIENTATION=+
MSQGLADPSERIAEAFRKLDASGMKTVPREDFARVVGRLEAGWTEDELERLLSASGCPPGTPFQYEAFAKWLCGGSDGRLPG